MPFQGEGEFVTALPAVLRQQGRSGGEIGERGSIGGGGLGAPTREQVKLRQPFALVSRRDQGDAAVELIDDVEDRLVPLFRGRVRGEQPADPQVRLGAQLLRYERIGGLLDAVV